MRDLCVWEGARGAMEREKGREPLPNQPILTSEITHYRQFLISSELLIIVILEHSQFDRNSGK